MKMKKKSIDLFDQIVGDAKVHIAFDRLRKSPPHWGARRLMNDLFQRMGDPDGNFVQDFQSHGFHSRLFELACHAYFEAQGLSIDRSLQRPDFLISYQGHQVGVEAVTTNPISGRDTDVAIFKMDEISFEEILKKTNNEFSIRIGSALLTKLKKRYWNLPHCKGTPFVLLVGPFHEPGSVLYIDECLARYLYGIHRFNDWTEHNGLLVREVPIKTHESNGKSIQSNFFAQQWTENISAIAFCNQFTIPRFYRMAMQLGLYSKTVLAIRKGFCMLPGGGRGDDVHEYQYGLNDPQAPQETWWQGVTFFHNPNARYPLPKEAFACTSAFRYHNGQLERKVYDAHTLTSFMYMTNSQ
ncbi:hypothetical protein [Archangium violaceum]|uniref:hypothetical protein n=1 Tax=Archangium violaceum TaxID=83451 RepID=UPI0013637B92|nr:hypothetical protein [Archangium violaceum]